MVKVMPFSYEIYKMLVERNKERSKEIIKKMGSTYICHPENHVKRLKKPFKW